MTVPVNGMENLAASGSVSGRLKVSSASSPAPAPHGYGRRPYTPHSPPRLRAAPAAANCPTPRLPPALRGPGVERKQNKNGSCPWLCSVATVSVQTLHVWMGERHRCQRGRLRGGRWGRRGQEHPPARGGGAAGSGWRVPGEVHRHSRARRRRRPCAPVTAQERRVMRPCADIDMTEQKAKVQ